MAATVIGAKWMRKCAHPGCGARVLTHDCCERHRPPPDREPESEVEREARRAKNRASRARARAKHPRPLPGVPLGWEV